METYKIVALWRFFWACSFCLANESNDIADMPPYDTIHLNDVLKIYPKSPSLNGSFSLSSNEFDLSHSGTKELISLSVFLSRQDIDRSILITSCDVDLDTQHLKKVDSYFLHINWILGHNVLECFLHLYDRQNFTTINSSSLVHENLFGRNSSTYFVHFSLRRGSHPLDVCVSDFSVSNQVLNLSTTCLASDTTDRLRTIDFSESSSTLLRHNLDRIDYDARCCSDCDQRCREITVSQHDTVTHIDKSTVIPVLTQASGNHVSEFDNQGVTVMHHFTNITPAQNDTVQSVGLHSPTLHSIDNDSADWTLHTVASTLHFTPFRNETVLATQPEFDANSTNIFIIQHNFLQNQSIFSEVPVTAASTVCSINPCMNDGICHIKNDSQLGHVCQCNSAYYGDGCQYYDYCKNSFGKPACLNGGVCKSLDGAREQDFELAGKRGYFSCKCRDGFSGVRCQTPPLSTLSVTPVASGVSPPASAVLTGKRRPTSPLTPEDIVCQPNPCQHNGTCSPAASLKGFLCNCTEGWSGEDCSQRRRVTSTLSSLFFTSSATSGLPATTTAAVAYTLLIDDQDCRLNKSLCRKGFCDDSGQCRCDSGYSGKHCEITLKEDPCFLAPCQNNATCHPINATQNFTCQCADDFRGVFCNETAVGGSSSGSRASSAASNVGAIVGGVFGTLALVCLAVGGYFLYKYVSKSRKLRGKYNPAKEEMNTVGGHPVPLATLNTGERLI